MPQEGADWLLSPLQTHRRSHKHDLLLEAECLPVCERVLPSPGISLAAAVLYTVHLQEWDVKRLQFPKQLPW